MILTVQHLVELIDALPKNEPFDYVIPGDNKVIIVATNEDSIKMDKLKSDGSRKSCGMSKEILECIADSVQERVPFSVDSIFNGSGSGRSAWEAALASTTEFYKCKVGKQKHLIWVPEEPHLLGVPTDFTGTIATSDDNLSPENVKRMFEYYLVKCCKTSHRTDQNPLYLSGNAPGSYMSFLQPDRLFDYNPAKWSHINSIYEITDPREAESIFTQLIADPAFVERDKENNQGWRSGAIGYYVCFLNALNQFSKVVTKSETSAEPKKPVKSTLIGPFRKSYLTEGMHGFVWQVLKFFNNIDGAKELLSFNFLRIPDKFAWMGACPVGHVEEAPITGHECLTLSNGVILSDDCANSAVQFEKFVVEFNSLFAGRYVIEVTQNEQGDEVYYLHKIGDDATISPAFRPYVTAIKSKPFLLLAGISGTGKSRIVRQLARACWNANSEEYKAHKPSNFEMVQVKPNWHDSSELIGYVSRVSGQPVYVAGPFLKFVAKAWENPTVPYFLCLDEMNLAPVEQYFAEYLSVVESRKAENGVVMTDPIIEKVPEQWYYDLVGKLTEVGDLQDRFKSEGISIPQNLIVVGTVNMDETTFSFSRKVLDRAMTIEMNEVDLYGGLRERNDAIGHLSYNAIIGSAVEGVDVYSKHTAVCDKVLAYLKEVNDKLEQTPFKVAYRTRNEFLLYVVNNLTYGNTPRDIATAVDEITSMKILSRIEGDETKVDKLFKNDTLLGTIKAQLQILCADYNVEESVSVKKLIEMKKRLDSGYTSFWS